MMNNELNNTQLDEMIRQMETLKKKLEQQQIVNDHLIRRSMKSTMSSLNRRCYAITILALLMIPCSYYSFVKLVGLSIPFWIATCVMMLADGGANFYNGKDLRNKHLMKSDMLEVSRKMARAKKFDSQSLLYSIPALILWLVWLGYEFSLKVNSEETFAFICGATVGGIIGGILGVKVHLKTQRQYQEIIDQIEDLTKE